jgi:hypothetical protein
MPQRRSFPAEVWVALGFAAVWAAGIFAGLPVNLPDGGSLRFVQRHYFSPLFLAGGVQLGVACLAAFCNARRKESDPFLMFKLLPFMVLVLFLHFNFKAWMPLVNATLHDDLYQRIDVAFAPVVSAFLAVRQWVASHVPWNVDPAYHTLFVGMFFVSTCVHGLLDTRQGQRELVLGLCLILLLGGMAYWVAPAEGPFLFRDGLNLASQQSQERMHGLFEQVRATGTIPGGYFASPPAAMPSLHIAHALVMTLYAARALRWLLVLYVPVLLWIVVESVASGWHYLIDLPVGALLAIFCMILARRLVRQTAG